MDDKKILIVGAGIAGLCMYHALKQQGIKSQIIEKQPHWHSGGSGIALPANSVLGLIKLGFGDALLSKAHRVEAIEYALANGDTLAIASLLEPPLNRQPFVALLRSDLIEILNKGVDSVRFSTSVTEIIQNMSGVEVRLSSGGSEHYDLLIAADGIHSTTRANVFAHARVNALGLTNWRFLIQRDTARMHPVYYLDKDDAFMLYPVSATQVYCYGHVADKTAQYLSQPPLATLKQRFANYHVSVTSAIDSISDENTIIPGRIEAVETDEVAAGRVVLIGDALHGCPPTLQQGAGQAVQDALVLSKLLAVEDIDSALRQFKTIRMPQIRWVVEESNHIMKLGLRGKYWWGRALRNFTVRKSGPANVKGWRTLMDRFYSTDLGK